MNLDFLPNLPKSDLDDRTQQDLVEEALLRIPRYCPEWTNYSASDPGVTLIELFGWVTEQMLQRFNQVPRRNYVTFLELLGVRLNPPMPARTNLTFYLNVALDEPYQISAGTEVATVRTELEEAVVFSTDEPLTIGVPQIRHVLTSATKEETPQVLQDRLTNYWSQSSQGEWFGPAQTLFAARPQADNCMYIVLAPTENVSGNVVALTVTGAAAATTGIDPNRPPRRWEAWTGTHWAPVLRAESDDLTQGFSFHQLNQQRSTGPTTAAVTSPSADILLHLPSHFPEETFATYRGHWLRCVCLSPTADRPAYAQSPLLQAVSIRGIGGTVSASQCQVVYNEQLGISDGTAGQTFQLFAKPVLQRSANEHLQVTLPNGFPETWQEVSNFANSGPDDRHYIIDSITGTVQLGPSVKDPGYLRQAIAQRQIQFQNANLPQSQTQSQPVPPAGGTPAQEQQYGQVPPKGAVLQMVAYRTGGGERGNVQSGRLQVLKTALPYVASVTNREAARHGTNAESLEAAAIRAPALLRNRDRAVTIEDFEFLTQQAAPGAVAQCKCLAANSRQRSGGVQILIVPVTHTADVYRGEGMHPDRFQVSPSLKQQISRFLDERKLLGTRIELGEPDYVGVSVRAEVGLDIARTNLQARESILKALRISLYRFLNPLTGGLEGKGWPFGQCVHVSDVMGVLRQVEGVSYIGALELFELRHEPQGWIRKPVSNRQVDPGPTGLICSWRDRALRSNHTINAL